MNTRITDTLDGYTIILGLGIAQVDPEATRPIVEEAITSTNEYAAVEAKKNEITPLIKTAAQSFANAKAATSKADKAKYVAEYQTAMEKVKIVESEISAIYPALETKLKELTQSNAVYFQPKSGETIITDTEAATLTTALQSAAQNDCFLALNSDGSYSEIEDNRGKTVWLYSKKSWSSRDITKIGDTLASGEIFTADLTASQIAEITAQKETERVAALTKTQKAEEKSAALASLVSQAAAKKSELEITGSTSADALAQAQAWYSEQAALIETKYA